MKKVKLSKGTGVNGKGFKKDDIVAVSDKDGKYLVDNNRGEYMPADAKVVNPEFLKVADDEDLTEVDAKPNRSKK